MKSWPIVQLDDICSSVDYGHTASATPEPIGPKFLRITDIQNGQVDWQTVPFCDCKPADEASSRLKSGDIVFARTGATTGKSFLIQECPDRAVFASYLIRVRASEQVMPAYLAHFFQTSSYWAQITRSARGAAQAGVNATSLKSLELPLPPFDEQRRIAAILDAAATLRAKRRAAIAKIDILVQSIFIEMFGDALTNPKGWPIVHLVNLLSLPLRNGLSPSTGGLTQAKVLTLSAVTGDRFDPTAWKEAPFEATPPDEQRVRATDLLICRGNGNLRLVGKGYFPNEDMKDVTFPDTIIAGLIPIKSFPNFSKSFGTHRQPEDKLRHWPVLRTGHSR
jgi:type I restriction enzyme, S subunit